MRLLAVDEAKSKEKKADADRAKRISKLNDEETKLAQRINDAKRDAKSEMAAIEDSLTVFKGEKEQEKQGIQNEICFLKREVEKLETRRTKALEPIEEIREEAEVMLKEAWEKHQELVAWEVEIKNTAEELTQASERVMDKEDELDEKREDLSRREKIVVLSEIHTKDSAEKVAAEWVKFHAAVHEQNKDISRREKEVQDAREALISFKESLDRIAAEQVEARRAIKDGYDSLARARNEILGRSK